MVTVKHKKNMDIVPKLRFHEFEKTWERKRVGEICDFIVPGRNKPTDFTGDIPWITTPDINHNTSINFSKNGLTISKEEAKRVGSKIVPINSIIISCVGELGLVAIAGKKIVINQQLHAFIPKEEINYRFLLYGLSVQKKYMDKVATKTAVPYMNKDNCNSIPITFPSLPEQKKIASFLSEVDRKIQQLTRKKKLLEQYKKGVMQKIFSQEIRFKNENRKDYPDWERVELGEILDYVQPTKYLVESTEYDDSYTTPVLTAGKTFILGYSDENRGIFTKGLPVIIFDDFTTAFKYVDFPFKAKSSAMKILKVKKNNVNFKFVYESMKGIRFPLGEHKRYWISEYQYMKINYPSVDEQKKISEFLSSVDNKIAIVNNHLNQTQKFKKGLLQQMFI